MKNALKLAAFLLTAAFLSSCTANPVSSTFAQENRPQISSGVSLRMLHRPPEYSAKEASTAKGRYYFSSSNTQMQGMIQVYLDYASGQEIPLCQRPECTHTGEDCPAFFPMTWGSACEAVVSDKLYYLFSGNAGQNEMPKLIRTELNGLDRTELMTFSDGSDYNALLATDETNLYLIRKIYQQLDEEYGETQIISELVKINLQKKEISVLHTWQGAAYLLDTQGDSFFVRAPTSLPKPEDAVQSYAIERISSKGDMLSRAELEVPTSNENGIANNSLFWLDAAQKTIFCYDFIDQQTRDICTDISWKSNEFASFTGVYGNHILLELVEMPSEGDGMKGRYLAFPIAGGPPCEVNLAHTRTETINHVIRIIDEVDDTFLVIYDTFVDVVKGYDPSGNLATFEYLGYKKAFIKQSDFFANNPAYYNKVTPWQAQLS